MKSSISFGINKAGSYCFLNMPFWRGVPHSLVSDSEGVVA
jgi:hypothetical protein